MEKTNSLIYPKAHLFLLKKEKIYLYFIYLWESLEKSI